MDSSLNCLHCGRELAVDSAWTQVNYCRGFTLLPWILNHPGLSAWELAGISGMGYAQVSKGVAKLRDLEFVRGDPEPREAGGFRYRYYPWPDHPAQVTRMEKMMPPVKSALLS